MPNDAVEAAIASFKASPPSPKGENQGKIDAVLAIEAQVSDPRAMAFLVTVATDQSEYDLARIEAVKILGLSQPTPSQALGHGEALGAALLGEADSLVAEYLAMNLGPFLIAPTATEAVASCLHPERNKNIRHNALFSIERAGPIAHLLPLLVKAAIDPELSAGAKRILASWGPNTPA